MAKHYKEWEPDPYDPGDDPLSAQVGDRETESIQRDPEIDAKPEIVHVFNGRQAQPVPAQVDHYLPPGPSERVEVRQHLDQPPVSTDRHSDDALNRAAAEREANR